MGRAEKRFDELTMSTVRYTKSEIRKRKGRIDHTKVRAATEKQIAAWKRDEDVDDSTLGPVRAIPPATDVAKLRGKLGLSQEEFAARYMLPLRTIQEWEQERRAPSEPARVLLYAISRDPKAIARALRRGA